MADEWVSGKPIALVLAVVLVAAATYKWWPSDERAIKRQLDAVADVLTVPSTDTDASRAARLAELPTYFAPDVRVQIGDLRVASREDLMAQANTWQTPPGGVFVEFANVKIQNVTADSAQVSLLLKTTRPGPDASLPPETASYDVTVLMSKRDGDWLLWNAFQWVVTTGGSNR
jgi:hypothetical protein